MESGFGARSAWRQLVDLIGRGRVAPDDAAMARLRQLREAVPLEVRAASGRALAFASPPAPLVQLFAEDALAVAAPVLRTAALTPAEWLTLLPMMTPEGRALLRHRRDLPPAVVDGLEGYASVDFVLPAAERPVDVEDHPPVVVQAFKQAIEPRIRAVPPADAAAADTAPPPAPAMPAGEAVAMPMPEVRTTPQGGFRIADLVARIDAFQRQRDETPVVPPVPLPRASENVIRFETDADGMIRAIEGAARPALIGVSLGIAAEQGMARIDVAAGRALRQRRRFAGVQLTIGGRSEAAGAWRVAGTPLFDATSGRFTGFVCLARRELPAGDAAPAARQVASEALRQLVHELRTPTNAIAGFAELIEAQLLGPVPPIYRDHALTILGSAMQLIAAIDDLDTAARIEGGALDLQAEAVPLEPLLTRLADELSPLVRLRQTGFDIHPMDDHAAHVDSRALERLLSRLLAVLAGVAAPGERIDIAEAPAPIGQVALCFARPQALGTAGEAETLLSLDSDLDAPASADGPLLGVGFGIRLVRNLAREMGGALLFGEHLLTLRLPAHAPRTMPERATDRA